MFVAGLDLCGLGTGSVLLRRTAHRKRPARIGRIAPAINQNFIDTGALGDTAFYVGLEDGVAPEGYGDARRISRRPSPRWVQQCGGPRMTTQGRRATQRRPVRRAQE